MPVNGGKQRENTHAYPFLCRRIFLMARTTGTRFSDPASQFPEFGNTTPLPPNSCKMPIFCAFAKRDLKSPGSMAHGVCACYSTIFWATSTACKVPPPRPMLQNDPRPGSCFAKAKQPPPAPICTYDLGGLFVPSFFSAHLGTTKIPLMQFSPP